MKHFVLASLLMGALLARENPFLPTMQISDPSEVVEESEFSKIAFSFPEDARKLLRLHLEYLAVDGSVKDYFLDIDQPIDWHKIYMLLSENELNKKALEIENNAASAPILAPTAPAFTQVEPDANTIAKPLASNTQAPQIVQDSNASSDELNISENEQGEQIALGKHIVLIANKKSVRVNTKAKLIRQFALSNPARIVLDFEKLKLYKAHTFPLVNSKFDAIGVGIHKDFIRVVLHSDSKYDYDISYDDLGCEIKLK